MFTSTVNVAFFGHEVIGGTEDDEFEKRTSDGLDYVDAYSRSKKEAEDLILFANGKANLISRESFDCYKMRIFIKAQIRGR